MTSTLHRFVIHGTEYGISYVGGRGFRDDAHEIRLAAGEVISSSWPSPPVNQVISKHMVKKQQIRWSPRGAHLLLQVRTRMLKNDLASDFRRSFRMASWDCRDAH